MSTLKKNVAGYIVALMLGGMLLSCSDVINKEPLGILDASAFIKTPDDAIQAVNAAYEPLLISNNNNNWYWVLGTVSSDNAITGGDGSRPGIQELDVLTHTPRTQELNDIWALNYAGIIQCNVVIERVPDIDADPEFKDRVIGEALFLRAHYHFVLSQIYGDVPLITEVQAPDEVNVPRNSVVEVRQQVIQDCIDAADKLPAEYSGGDVGRATKGAALALAAKSALYLEDWNAVLDYVGQVKGLGVYDLMADYADNWRVDMQPNIESVWEVQHANLELGVGNNLNQWWVSKKVEDGYGFAEVTQELFDEYEPDDPRILATVAQKNEDYFGLVYKPSFSSTGYSPRKFLQSVEEVTQKSDGGINYTIIRFAEVLLWEAEALNELGRVQEAQAPLERVRARARAMASDPTTALPSVETTDQTEMTEAIRHERRIELAFEMHRFFDLVRWGVAQDYIPEFQQNKHEVFPIPQTEMDLNSMLTQNQGY